LGPIQWTCFLESVGVPFLDTETTIISMGNRTIYKAQRDFQESDPHARNIMTSSNSIAWEDGDFRYHLRIEPMTNGEPDAGGNSRWAWHYDSHWIFNITGFGHVACQRLCLGLSFGGSAHMASKSRILVWLIPLILVLATAGVTVHGCGARSPGRVVGLTTQEAQDIQRVVSHFRWTKLWEAAAARNFGNVKTILQSMAQGHARETGAIAQRPASSQASAYTITGSPSNTLWTYTLRLTTNGWDVVSASYAR
jgi:hypothetical protein